MKRSVLVLPLLLVAATVLADDKKNVVSVTIVSHHPKNQAMQQLSQYGVCDTLKNWGFSVQSKTPTSWDKFLEKGGVTVVPPPSPDKKDDKKKDEKKLDAPSFTIEGTVEFLPHKIPFYSGQVDVICFSTKVDVVIKDEKGKELKKIAWQNLHGLNKDAGEDKVIQACETLAVRYLLRDILETKEIAAQIPKQKADEFKKFCEEEDKFHEEHFDATEKHKVEDEKK